MSAAFVGEMETWPEPVPGWPLDVHDLDGEPSLFHRVDGGAEICLTGPRTDEGRRLVVVAEFETIDQAERAWRALWKAFAVVRAIQAETPLEPDDGHEHRERLVRWSRTIPWMRQCELCGANLGEVMPEYADVGGFVPDGSEV